MKLLIHSEIESSTTKKEFDFSFEYEFKYEFPQCIFFFGGDDRKCHIGKGFFSTNRLDKILGFYF